MIMKKAPVGHTKMSFFTIVNVKHDKIWYEYDQPGTIHNEEYNQWPKTKHHLDTFPTSVKGLSIMIMSLYLLRHHYWLEQTGVYIQSLQVLLEHMNESETELLVLLIIFFYLSN